MDKKLHILQHSLGMDQYGRRAWARNQFCTGPGSDDFDCCRELAELGLMFDHGPLELCGGQHIFTVTSAGLAYAVVHSEEPPKLTRGQKRYREYLAVSDYYDSFGHWLKSKEKPTGT
jgi:hypothetical protein